MVQQRKATAKVSGTTPPPLPNIAHGHICGGDPQTLGEARRQQQAEWAPRVQAQPAVLVDLRPARVVYRTAGEWWVSKAKEADVVRVHEHRLVL